MRSLKLLGALLLGASAALANKVVYTASESSIDGKPFMPRGVYAVGIGDMRRAASYGFNVIQCYQIPGMSDAELDKYMAAAGRNGLKVLLGLDAAKKLSAAEIETRHKRVKRYKGHAALYGWYLADEPSVKSLKPQELEELYNWIKKTDPDHPVFSSNWELGNFKKACDVDMPQLYFGGPSPIMRDHAIKHGTGAVKSGVQWIAIVNTYDAGFGDKKTPGTGCLNPVDIRSKAKKGEMTDAEAKKLIADISKNLKNPPHKPRSAFPDTPAKVRGQAFEMIAHGSNGIFYWLLSGENDIDPTWGYYTIFVHSKLRDALKDTLHEMDALWPRIANPAVNAKTWRDKKDDKIFYWCRAKGKTLTIIAVNESDADNHEAVTTIPELKGVPEATATLSGPERRALKIINGQLKDTFRANEAHVYLIDLK